VVNSAFETQKLNELPLREWLDHCQPGDTWTVPTEHLEKINQYQEWSDDIIRNRSDSLAIWREGENLLACKYWPYGKRPSRQESNKTSWKKKRIQKTA